MVINNKQHGGPRPGSGRPRRQVAKSLPIWCGQISPTVRQFILDTLSPDERLEALMTAAQHKVHTVKW